VLEFVGEVYRYEEKSAKSVNRKLDFAGNVYRYGLNIVIPVN